MHECSAQSTQLYMDELQLEELEEISNEALAIVEAEFGSGYPFANAEPKQGLPYHNRRHSVAVRDGAGRMAAALGLSQAGVAISRTSGSIHDLVQLKDRGVMERESAEWMAATLEARGIFPSWAAEVGSLACEGTEPILEDGVVVGQMVSHQEYPSKEAEEVAMSVASADLGELYAPHGPLTSRDYFLELTKTPAGVTPPVDERLIGFQQKQVQLTQDFRYPHPMGEYLFGGLRGEVVNYNTQVLGQLQRGEIETWDDLLAQDYAFALAHS